MAQSLEVMQQRGALEWRSSWPDVIVRTQTATAVDHLQRYYAIAADDKPRYTGSRFEVMAALNADPNTLGPEDFLAVSMLSVNVPAEAAIRLLGRDAAIINRLLSQIPTDVDIVDVGSEILIGDSPAGQLWGVLRRGRDGLGPTTTSKLLAAKRPRLLPIWDTFVAEATGLDTVDYWRKFQCVLTDDHGLIWNWLDDLRPLAPNLPSTIPQLRILDVLLWMSVSTGGGQAEPQVDDRGA